MGFQAASEQGEHGWVAIQDNIDVYSFPTASGSFSFTESPAMDQEPVYAENKEMSESYDEKAGAFCGYKAGSIKLNMNFKTSGTKGTLSPLHPFFLAAYGRHTVVSNTSVTYQHYRFNPVDPFKYLTILIKTQTFTHLLVNVRVKKMDIGIKKDALLPVTFECIFEKVLNAGNATLKENIDGTSTPVTIIPLNDAESYQRYQEGSYISIGTDDNSGAGFKITAVNKTGNTLTIEGGVTTVQDAGAAITGFTPVFSVSGNDINGGVSWTTANTGELGNHKIYCTDSKFSIENGVKPLEDVCSDNNQIGCAEGSRKILYELTRYYSTTYENTKYLIEKQVQIPFTIQVGQEDGNILQIVCPNWKIKKGNVSGKEAKTIAIQGQCYPSVGDDASTLVLK